MPTTFLTSKEREAYDAVPDDISYREIVQYFTLTPDDLVQASVNSLLAFVRASRRCRSN